MAEKGGFMNFPTVPHDIVLLLFEELNVSAGFAGIMAEWIGFPTGVPEEFGAKLLRCSRGNAVFLFSCTFAGERCSALLNICLDDLPAPSYCLCRQLKHLGREEFSGLVCAVIVPEPTAAAARWELHCRKVIPCGLIREYFLSVNDRRGKFIAGMLSDIRRGYRDLNYCCEHGVSLS